MKCVTTTLRRFSHWHFREIKRTPKQSHKWQIRFYSSLFFYNYTHFKCNLILQSLSFALVFFRFCIWLWNYNKLRMSSPLSFMCESLMLRRPISLSCFFLVCVCVYVSNNLAWSFSHQRNDYLQELLIITSFSFHSVVHFRRRSSTKDWITCKCHNYSN